MSKLNSDCVEFNEDLAHSSWGVAGNVHCCRAPLGPDYGSGDDVRMMMLLVMMMLTIAMAPAKAKTITVELGRPSYAAVHVSGRPRRLNATAPIWANSGD